MEKRKQFTFYESFYKALVKLPLEEAQQGLWAIVTYGLLGTLPEMEFAPAADAVFEMAKPVLDSARAKADAIAASNRRRAKNKDKIQSDSNVVPTTAHEGEKEKEIEVEVESEIEVETEKDKEKESLLHTGSVPLVCVRDEFDLFWEAYPLKLGKKQAWYIWKKNEPALDTVMTALECWKRSKKWRAEEGRYIPRAEKFLEEKHYEQPPKDAPPMGASGHLGKAELEAIEQLLKEEHEDV